MPGWRAGWLAGWLGRAQASGPRRAQLPCRQTQPRRRPRPPPPPPPGQNVFNPLNMGVVRRLSSYNRALRCRWPGVAAWNCTTCRTDFAPNSTRLLSSYLTKANVPGFDWDRGVTITSQDKVGAGAAAGRRAALRLHAARCTAQATHRPHMAVPAAGGACRTAGGLSASLRTAV